MTLLSATLHISTCIVEQHKVCGMMSWYMHGVFVGIDCEAEPFMLKDIYHVALPLQVSSIWFCKARAS